MIDRKLYLKMGSEIVGYVRVDEEMRDKEDLVEVGVGPNAHHGTAHLDLEDFKNLVVILNEAAKYFGYELVMSPVSIKKKSA